MKTSYFHDRLPVLLLMAGFAGLMALCWRGGREAGKARGEHRVPALSGTALPSVSKSGAGGSPAGDASGSPEETEALLQSTLQSLEEWPETDTGTFNGHLKRARLISALAELDTPRLLALVDALMAKGSTEAEEMAGRILGPVLTARDPARVWTWLHAGAAAGKPVYERFLSGAPSIFGHWAARDPQAALAAWEAQARPLVEAGKVSGAGLGEIFLQWTSASPAAALNALEKTGSPAERREAAQTAFRGLRRLFEGEAAGWSPEADALVSRMLALAGDRARGGIEEIMKARLTRQTPEETAAWAGGLEATPEQQVFIDKSIADPWMARDPAAAAAWYADRAASRDPAARGEALERVIRKWTRAGDNNVERESLPPPDLAAASEWLIAQGLNVQSQAAMAVLARAWGEAREPEAALAWARALPKEAARAEALAAVTEEIRRRFPNDWRRLTEADAP